MIYDIDAGGGRRRIIVEVAAPVLRRAPDSEAMVKAQRQLALPPSPVTHGSCLPLGMFGISLPWCVTHGRLDHDSSLAGGRQVVWQ